MAQFYLIRHGDKDHSEIMAGRSPGIHLTISGRQQARRLAAHLARVPVTGILSSPRERAIETAAPLAKIKRLPIQAEAAFDEVDMGDWTGRSRASVARLPSWKRFRRSSVDAAIPGGETLAEVQCRMVSAMIRLRDRKPNARWVVATHEDLVRLAVCYFIGAPISVYESITIRTGSITLVDLDADGATLQLMDVLPERDPRLVLQ